MGSRYSVLLYHGVHEDNLVLEGRNIFGKHISETRFASEMAWLASNRPVVTMLDIAEAHHGGREIPDGAVAVTFDDGFRNNYDTAWPILEHFKIPATIYIATGYIDTGRMIWTDRLEAAFLGTKRKHLNTTTLGPELIYSLKTRNARVAAFLELKARCKKFPATKLESLVDEILTTLDYRPKIDSPLYAFLTWKQIKTLANSPLIDIGAHTIDHVSLARITPDDMRHQINESLRQVGDALNKPCRLFAYPEGTDLDYNNAVIKHLQSIGIDHAPSAVEGDNEIGVTGPFHIRRYLVGIEGRRMPLHQKQT